MAKKMFHERGFVSTVQARVYAAKLFLEAWSDHVGVALERIVPD